MKLDWNTIEAECWSRNLSYADYTYWCGVTGNPPKTETEYQADCAAYQQHMHMNQGERVWA